MLEDANECCRTPRAVDNRSVVEGVADDEVAFGRERWNRGRVGGEPHVVHDGVLLHADAWFKQRKQAGTITE